MACKNTGRIGDTLKFGLVAHYPFDGNATDVSGSNNHGTVNGATLSADRGQITAKLMALMVPETKLPLTTKPYLLARQTERLAFGLKPTR